MKKTLTFATLFVAATAAGLAAQQPQPPTAPGMPADRAGAPAPVTVTGCVERSGEGSAARFKLTRVERAGASTTTDAARPATPAQPAAPAPGASSGMGGASLELPKEYVLKASGAVDLNPHASHKVEVTGTADDKKVSASGAPMPRPSGSPTVRDAEGDAPTLNVTALKMIAATCS